METPEQTPDPVADHQASSGSEVDGDCTGSGEIEIGRGGLHPKADKLEAVMMIIILQKKIILCTKYFRCLCTLLDK